ncbi:hypothetical protein QBC36DRAFT_124155, partial [Triangularia setosa]
MTLTMSLASMAIVGSLLQPALASYWTATEVFVYEPTPMPYGCDEAGVTARQCTTAYDYCQKERDFTSKEFILQLAVAMVCRPRPWSGG